MTAADEPLARTGKIGERERHEPRRAATPSRTPLVSTSRRLAREADRLRFGAPVACVYNPLTYARATHEIYLERWARPGVDALLVGMNPGPWGMVQTGVPFGEVDAVRDWLGIEARIGRPRDRHPKRPIEGFACRRSEVSGRRLWGWARERFGTPDRFFERFFVWNYCPLAFLEASGRNRTPDRLEPKERASLFAICDDALRAVVRDLAPRHVVGIGTFARDRARAALGIEVGMMLHPSPASPIANRGWAARAERDLERLGIDV